MIRTLWLCLIAWAGVPQGSAPAVQGKPAAAPASRTWTFDDDTPGEVPRGFTAAVGRWVVAADGKNRVLAQTAKSDDDTFNVALVEGTSYATIDLSVRLRAVAGELDQGGGLVWRAKDAKNYYIARFNPIEDNFRVYKVVDGQRTQLGDATLKGDREWHTLRVTMAGDQITCSLDGKKYLEARDATFAGAGKIGLWSKADAQSWFDDLTVGGK